MATKKLLNQVADAINESSETRLTVLSFRNGKRDSSCGGLGLLDAFAEMSSRCAEGLQVILTDEEGDDVQMRWEIVNNGRVPYEIMLPYAVHFRTYDYSRRHRSDRPKSAGKWCDIGDPTGKKVLASEMQVK